MMDSLFAHTAIDVSQISEICSYHIYRACKLVIRLVPVECVTVECGISKCKQREEGEWQFSGQFALKGEGSSIKGSNIYYRRGDGGVHQDFLLSTFLLPL